MVGSEQQDLRNHWTDWAEGLAPSYAYHAGSILGAIRFELVTRSLLEHLGSTPAKVIDVGGGYGQQAIMLGRAGHDVVVVDPDETMLETAQARVSAESSQVQSRIRLVQGFGEHAIELVGSGYDLACCHSVLMYLPDPTPMLRSLVGLIRTDGLISILTLNERALAMRPGLQGTWEEALTTLKGEPWGDDPPVRADDVDDMVTRLAAVNARSLGWRGVRIFTDHLRDVPAADDFEAICELEWEASGRDPYRGVARLFHLIGQRH
jgi:2-polyprenyl-3-methyl-5-hydroxy-6-metoxy-1,4-benzoquinol methylase